MSDLGPPSCSGFRKTAGHRATDAIDCDSRALYFATSRRGGGADQRSAAASSVALASTQILPETFSTCFQNGARVLS
jgi:hypothetical protein